MKTKHTLHDGTVLVRGHAHANGNELDGMKHEHDPFPTRLTAAEKHRAAKLTTAEQKDWQRALKVIDKGWSTFIEVGLALRQIRDSRLYREDYPSWEAFCREVVGVSKTEANRQIIDAEVVETLKAPIGVTGDGQPPLLPTNRAQARALAKLKDADARRKVWEQVAITSANDAVSARLISETAASLIPQTPPKKPATNPRSANPDNVRADGKPNIPELLEMLVRARREDDWSLVDTVIEHLKTTEFATSPTKPNDRESDLRDEQAEGEALPDEKVVTIAEIVTAAMVAVAPTHEQSMGTAKLEKDTTASQRNLPVTEKGVRAATAESESQQDTADFMSAQLFHDFVHPGEDYATWLDETAKSHPADVRIPNDGGGASISLIRARQFAFNTQTETGKTALMLINEAQSSRNGNPGATADALFQHALAANHSSS